MDLALKEEWLERVKITNRKEMFAKGGRYHVNTELHLAPEEIQQDRDVVLNALLIGKEFMWNISSTFQNDKEFILHLIENNYEHDIYRFCYQLREDKEIFEKCMIRKDDIRYIGGKLPDNILADRDLIWRAFQHHNFYNYIKDDYKYDLDIMRFHLLHYNPEEYKNLPKRILNKLKNDKQFHQDLIDKHHENYSTHSVYQFFSDELKHDLVIIHHLLQKRSSFISLIPKDILNDKAFILYAIAKYNIPIYSLDDHIKNDPDVIHAIIEKDGRQLPYFKEVTDLKIAKLALKTCPDINILNSHFLTSKELVIDFLNAHPLNCDVILKLAPYYKDDYDIVKILVAYKGSLLKDTSFQDNEELKDLALQTATSLTLLTKKSIYNKPLVIQLLKEQAHSKSYEIRDFLYTKPPYQDDKEVAFICIQNNADYFKFFPNLQKDTSFIISCLEKGIIKASHIDPSLLLDKELMLLFVNKDANNYNLLPLSLRDDIDIVSTMMKSQINNEGKMINQLLFDRLYDSFALFSSKGKDVDFHTQLVEQVPEVYESQYISMDLKNSPSVVRAYLNHTKNPSPSRSPAMMTKYNTSDHNIIKTSLNQEYFENILEKQTVVYKPKI